MNVGDVALGVALYAGWSRAGVAAGLGAVFLVVAVVGGLASLAGGLARRLRPFSQ